MSTSKPNSKLRVVRGGAWFHARTLARTAFRNSIHPVDRYNHIGFRVVCASPTNIYLEIEEELRRLKLVAQSILPSDIALVDVVYRPFDMSAFGKKGYNVTLTRGPYRVISANFNTRHPTDDEVKAKVTRCIEVLND